MPKKIHFQPFDQLTGEASVITLCKVYVGNVLVTQREDEVTCISCSTKIRNIRFREGRLQATRIARRDQFAR